MTAPAKRPDPIVQFLWNFLTGARLSTYPQPRTRTWRALWSRWVGLAATAGVVWAAAARWQSSGLTSDATAAEVAGEYGDMLRLLWAGCAAGLFAAGRAAMQWWCLRPHRAMWVEPLHWVMYKPCGWPMDSHPEAYLAIPEDFEQVGLRIRLPREFSFTELKKKEVEEAARAKLPLSGMAATWSPKGSQRWVEFKPVQKPKLPRTVPYSDPEVSAAITGSRDGNPYLGVVAGGKAYRIDLTSETPHMLLAAGTGAGKSRAAMVLACQLMHHGAGVIVLDLKQRSQLWCADLPGVIYCRSVPHMHRVLVALGREIARRSQAANANGGQEVDQPRILVIAEEMTATMGRLRQHWIELRAQATPEARREMPTKSPAVQAYEDALLMGRAEKVNVIAIVQMGTARSLGGPEAREQYGFRGASRFSENARKMLFPTSKIRSSTKPGRWVVVKGDEDSEVQIALLSDEEAQAIATSGRRSRLTLGRVDDPGPVDAPVDDGSPHLHVVRDTSHLVSLREASSDEGRGVVDRALSTLRKDRHERRDEGFPAAVATRKGEHLYDPAHLVQFYVGHHPSLAADDSDAEHVTDVEVIA